MTGVAVCDMAVMAMTLCMVLSGSLGTPLSSSKGQHGLSQPTGWSQGADWMFYLTFPQTATPDCWARQDKHGSASSAFWFWPPVPGSNHLLLIVGCGCKSLVDWLEHCSKPPPTVCPFACHEQPLGSGSCSQCLRARPQKSFLADFWHLLAIISYSPVHSQTVRCVFPSPVIPARSGCSWRHIQDTHPAQGHSQHTLTHRLGCACALPPHQWGLSDSPCIGNNDQQPPATIHSMSAQSTDTGLASSDSTCQQYLMSPFSHTSPL